MSQATKVCISSVLLVTTLDLVILIHVLQVSLLYKRPGYKRPEVTVDV